MRHGCAGACAHFCEPAAHRVRRAQRAPASGAPPQQLPVALRLAERQRPPPRRDRTPAGQDAVADAPHVGRHVEAGALGIQVVEKQAADAAVLLAEGDVKVPGMCGVVCGGARGVACVLWRACCGARVLWRAWCDARGVVRGGGASARGERAGRAVRMQTRASAHVLWRAREASQRWRRWARAALCCCLCMRRAARAAGRTQRRAARGLTCRTSPCALRTAAGRVRRTRPSSSHGTQTRPRQTGTQASGRSHRRTRTGQQPAAAGSAARGRASGCEAGGQQLQAALRLQAAA